MKPIENVTPAPVGSGHLVRHPLFQNGKWWVCVYRVGFLNHCKRMIDLWEPNTVSSTTGNATVTLPNAADEGRRQNLNTP